MSGMKSKMDQESKYQERRAGAVAVDLEETRFFAMWGEMCKKEGCEECPSSPCRRMQKVGNRQVANFQIMGWIMGRIRDESWDNTIAKSFIFLPDLPFHPLQLHMLLLQAFKVGIGRIGVFLEGVIQGGVFDVVLLELLGFLPQLLP